MENLETVKLVVTIVLSAIALIGGGKLFLDRLLPPNKTRYKNKPMGKDQNAKDLTPH